MKAWSLATVFDSVIKLDWQAINTGMWQNIRGPKELPFRDRVKLYFPPNEAAASQNVVLRRFYLLQSGYLRQFWTFQTAMTPQEREDMYDALGDIFRNIQCLPGVRITNNSESIGSTWRVVNGCIQVIVNPSYYMIKGIGNDRPRRRGHRSSKAVVSERDTLLRQMEKAGVPEQDRGRILREALKLPETMDAKRRSRKSKNVHAPPRHREDEDEEMESVREDAPESEERDSSEEV